MRLSTIDSSSSRFVLVGGCYGVTVLPEIQLQDYYAGYRLVGALALSSCIVMVCLSIVFERLWP